MDAPTPARPGRPPRGFYLNKIPGYREALTRARTEEFRTREDNWLPLAGTIGGCKVRVLTVRDYVALMRVGSPLLCRQEPTFEDIGKFLWFLSPEIERWHNHHAWRKPWLVGCRWSLFSIERWQIRWHSKTLRRRLRIAEIENAARAHYLKTGQAYEIPEDSPFAKAIVECFAYIDRMFFDRPAGIARDGVGSGLLYLTSWFDAIQSEYHKPDLEVWRMPIPQLFARLKAIAQRRHPSEPDFNARQDALISKIQHALNHGEVTQEQLLRGEFKLN
jgi:hypothetical protein